MKNHFIFPYAGNKREEVEIIYDNIDLKNKKYIIEPFCGTAAMSYYIASRNPGKYKYVLNDNNKLLATLYEIMKDPIKTLFFNCMLELVLFKLKKLSKWNDRKLFYKTIPQDAIGYYIHNKIYSLRNGVYPTIETERSMLARDNRIKDDACIVIFLRSENVILHNDDAINIVKKYNKKNSVILLDPPYMFTTDSYYKTPTITIYKFLHQYKSSLKSSTYMILEYSWILELIYFGCPVVIYDKKYSGMTKKKVKHAIITLK